MDFAYLGLLLANLFVIVYFRLMIHYHQQGGAQRAGLATVVSLPGRKGLEGGHLKYWRNYWLALGMLCVLVAAGLLWRYPHIAAGFRITG